MFRYEISTTCSLAKVVGEIVFPDACLYVRALDEVTVMANAL